MLSQNKTRDTLSLSAMLLQSPDAAGKDQVKHWYTQVLRQVTGKPLEMGMTIKRKVTSPMDGQKKKRLDLSGTFLGAATNSQVT